MAPDFKGLALDYPSFELLWFDIETKVRHMLEEQMEPIVDRVLEQKSSLQNFRKEQSSFEKRIDKLEDTVFRKNAKLDIFEEIHIKIAKLRGDHKILED
jgi:hypothetical protein